MLFPGGASSQLLVDHMIDCGSDAIDEVPASRWVVRSDLALPGAIAVVRGTAVRRGRPVIRQRGIWNLIAEVSAMDLCQRLLLDTARRCTMPISIVQRCEEV